MRHRPVASMLLWLLHLPGFHRVYIRVGPVAGPVVARLAPVRARSVAGWDRRRRISPVKVGPRWGAGGGAPSLAGAAMRAGRAGAACGPVRALRVRALGLSGVG